MPFHFETKNGLSVLLCQGFTESITDRKEQCTLYRKASSRVNKRLKINKSSSNACGYARASTIEFGLKKQTLLNFSLSRVPFNQGVESHLRAEDNNPFKERTERRS